MKKLMFAIAAVAAGTVLADVTSANVVGYQKTAYAVNGGSTVGVSTFAKVDGSAITLKDLKVIGGTMSQNLLQFLENDGRTKKYTYTDEQWAEIDDYYSGEVDRTVSAVFFYVGQTEAEKFHLTPGWYAQDDYDCVVNLSEIEDFDVSFGNGFFFQPNNAQAQLQFSGEVVKGDSTLDIPVNGGSSLTGNCSPVDFDLGHFSVAGGTMSQNLLQFLENDARTQKYTYTDEQWAEIDDYYSGEVDRTVSAVLFYLGPTEAAKFHLTPGWYAQDDYDCVVNLSTCFTVKSGEGFFYQPNVAAAKLVIPGAID